MFLIDTNVFLEILLDQDNAERARRFLGEVDSERLFISDFSLHSIGVILFKLGHKEILVDFVQDVITRGGVRVLGLLPTELEIVKEVSESYGLDFDDSYQYVVSKKFDFQIVSFDSDFDVTDRDRRIP